MTRGFTAAAAAGSLESEPKKVTSGGLLKTTTTVSEMNRKGLDPARESLIHLLCCDQLQNDNAYKVLSEMVNSGFLPSVATYNVLLHAYCRDKRVDEAMGILRGMAVEPNVVSFNTVIDGLCAKRRIKEAEELLQEMNSKGLAPDSVTYNTLITAMSKNTNLVIRAIALYDQMKQQRIPVPWTTYTSLIHLLCTYNVDKAYKVFTEMIASGFEPSLVTYNELIHAYCCRDRVQDAMGIFRGMPDRGLTPDAVICNTLITFFCKYGELEKAFEMRAEMVERGILPNADTYSKLIDCLCPQRRLSEAFDLFREMLGGGLSPREYAYFNLVGAYCLVGEFSKAFHLRDEMIHKGFLPDFVTEFSPSLVTYNALIYGNCLLGRVEEALGILRGMAEMSLSPDDVSYNIVISGFCKLGELGKAFELMVEMDEAGGIRGVDLAVFSSLMKGLSDEVNYNSVINAYCAEGEVSKALILHDEMEHHGSLRASVLYIMLFDGFDKKARTRGAKESLLRMFYDLCTSLPTFTYDTLIENCSNNEFKSVVELAKGFGMRGLKNEAASVLNTVLQWNYKPDGAVYNFLIVEHCRRRNVDKAYNMYMEMVHYGFASHMFSVLALIKALFHVGRHNEVRRVIQNVLRSCNINGFELHKALSETGVIVREDKVKDVLLNVLAEIAMDGLLLNGGKCSYAPANSVAINFK
ncbi:pentatricopeptide repeat-containing protein At5g39710-like [Lotus japonicus]|uniref:pentatricopeptide repeat-containing protein At5g39710-like n=1 Tax=Lotus japonicus TaxID=34305 RepID=UPI002587DBBA|nr:pentatricopeptide repeat-containing protein At5g39710-like [Lotus japonicus]